MGFSLFFFLKKKWNNKDGCKKDVQVNKENKTVIFSHLTWFINVSCYFCQTRDGNSWNSRKIKIILVSCFCWVWLKKCFTMICDVKLLLLLTESSGYENIIAIPGLLKKKKKPDQSVYRQGLHHHSSFLHAIVPLHFFSSSVLRLVVGLSYCI